MRAVGERRWFRFSLRTLFVLVTALCVWLGYELKIVRERRDLLTWLEDNGGQIDDDYKYSDPFSKPRIPLPWYRRMLGDRDAFQIILPKPLAEDDRSRVKKAFPEAEMWTILNQRNALPTPAPEPGTQVDEKDSPQQQSP